MGWKKTNPTVYLVYLGDSGGWRECHRVSPETALELIEQCAEAMRTHSRVALPTRDAVGMCTYERTDERTYGDGQSSICGLSLRTNSEIEMNEDPNARENAQNAPDSDGIPATSTDEERLVRALARKRADLGIEGAA